ncbi:MAG: hypothetical protein RPT00_06575, partial [Gammaproteobacteria bacterium]
LLAQRWQDVTQLNDRVRNILKAEGKVDSKEVSLKCSVELNRFAGSASSLIFFCIPTTLNLLHHPFLEASYDTTQTTVT